MPQGNFAVSVHVSTVRFQRRSSGVKKSNSAPTIAITASSMSTPMRPDQKSPRIHAWTQPMKITVVMISPLVKAPSLAYSFRIIAGRPATFGVPRSSVK